MIKLLLVEDSPIIVAGISGLLEGLSEPAELHIAKLLTDEAHAFKGKNYNLVIVGGNFINQQLDVLMKMVGKFPSVPFLIFADDTAILPEKKLYQLGISGILYKNESTDEILKAIKLVTCGHKYLSQPLLRKLITNTADRSNHIKAGPLTAREKEIARMLAQGEKNLQIGKTLSLKPSTVSTFKTRIFHKLNVHNIIELMQISRNLA